MRRGHRSHDAFRQLKEVEDARYYYLIQALDDSWKDAKIERKFELFEQMMKSSIGKKWWDAIGSFLPRAFGSGDDNYLPRQ